jgi:hypothetical protein
MPSHCSSAAQSKYVFDFGDFDWEKGLHRLRINTRLSERSLSSHQRLLLFLRQ